VIRRSSWRSMTSRLRISSGQSSGTLGTTPSRSGAARRIGAKFTLEQIDIEESKNLAEQVEGDRLTAEEAGYDSNAAAPSLRQTGSSPAARKFADVRV
jgi:hypothetical protein